MEKTVRIYGESRIKKSKNCEVKPILEGFNVSFLVLEKGKSLEKLHRVTMNHKTLTWICDCEYFIFSYGFESKKGYCSHILSVLYKYDTKTFEKEINKFKYSK